ncbi:MAG: DUF349 domain-containing protein [Micrococcaceae bacterium]
MSEKTLTNELGYVDSEGRVFLGNDDDAKLLGQVPNSTPENALSYFTKKYDAIVASLTLNEQRIVQHGASARDITRSVNAIKENIAQGKAFGDIESLNKRVTILETQLENLKTEEQEQRRRNIEDAIAHREEIVQTIEQVAGQDKNKTQWKQSTEKINTAFEEWKASQRRGPRIPKAQEDALWQRIKKSRQVFDKNRREFYAKQNARNAEAKKIKQELITKARKLGDSTDWEQTTRDYKKLMNDWKTSPRVTRKEDEKLWKQFRDAQQTFFDNKQKAMDELDSSFAENIEPKKAILAEAEALLPIDDVRKSRKKFKNIVARFEEIGPVPRSEARDIEGRMRAVEKAHKDAEDKYWEENDPEKSARSSSMISQLTASIDKLEEDIANAKNDKQKKALEDELKAKQSWLDMLSKH